MVQCEMQRRKHPSIDLYAGIFNSRAFGVQCSKPRLFDTCSTGLDDTCTPSFCLHDEPRLSNLDGGHDGKDPTQLDLDEENGDSLCLSGDDRDGLDSCHHVSDKTREPADASGSHSFANDNGTSKINLHRHTVTANKGDSLILSESASILGPRISSSSASTGWERPGDSTACYNGPESMSGESSDDIYSISSNGSSVDVDVKSFPCSSKQNLQNRTDSGNVSLGEPNSRDNLVSMCHKRYDETDSHKLSSDLGMKARVSGEQELSGRGEMTGWAWNDGHCTAGRAGSSDSSSSCGGSSSGGSPMVSKPTKDARFFSSGNISVGKGSPLSMSSRSIGSTSGSENLSGTEHLRSTARDWRELVPNRTSTEMELSGYDHVVHRMGACKSNNSGFSTGHLARRRNAVNVLSNDKANLLSSGKLLVGGANGKVLSYGGGTKVSVKEEISGTRRASVDCGLLKKAQASSDPECSKNAGNEYYKRGHLSEALILYDRAVVLCPGVAAYRCNRAAALSGLGRLAEAVKECEEAIRLDPSHARARECALSLCIRLGLFGDAKKHLFAMGQHGDVSEAQRLRNIEKHYALCMEARNSGDWPNVIRESDAAVVAGADSAPQIFGFKAEALHMLQNWEDANSVCLAARKIESSLVNIGICPANSFLYLITSQLDMALGRFEEAVAAAESAARVDPNNVKATKLLMKARAVARARANGNDLFKVGRFFEALALYTEGLESDPVNAVLLSNRAACRLKLGQWEKAVEDCNAALKVQPNYTKALMRRASSLMKLERWEDALLDYEVLRKALPEDIEVARGFFDVQVAMKKSRGEVVYGMKFGVDVEEITNDEQFREAVKTPGLLVVQFVTRWSERCRQLSPFIDDLCRRHPCVNFMKVDAEDHPQLVDMERVSFIPTFKIYKNGQKMKEIIGPTEQSLEYAVKHYSS